MILEKCGCPNTENEDLDTAMIEDKEDTIQGLCLN